MKYLVSSLIVIVIFLTAGLSYYIGKSSGNNKKSAASVTGTLVTTSPTQTPTPTVMPGTKVSGGGILSFPKYELFIPDSWTSSRESQTKDDERVILSKDKYQITISQGGFGGAACLFPGEADIEGPSARYDFFKDITTRSGDKIRRSWTGEELKSKGFAICQNTQYGWGSPTLYGHISLITPSGSDLIVLKEMDSIIESITKI